MALVGALVAATTAVLLGLPWLWVVTAACVLGALALLVAPRRRAAAPDPVPPPEAAVPEAAPGPGVRDVDDLPKFFTHPPGAPLVLTAATDSPPEAEPGPAAGPPVAVDGDEQRRGRGTSALLAGAAVVVVLGVVTTAVVVAGGDEPSTAGSGAPVSGGSTPPRTSTAATSPTAASGAAASVSATAAPLTAAAASDLAATDLPPGDDGFTAAVSFAGVVLEPRAVGVTVAYPELRVSSDGDGAVVHLDLPVWNCLSPEAPADPVAAQCSRSLEEHADLGTPELVVERSGDRVELTGSFATYTRPNGSAPAYSGSSYEIAVQLTAAGSGATGTLTVGGTGPGATGSGTFSG